jgi:geranylgeranyl pyrophosphate synthase
MVAELARAAGAVGMVGGQALDLVAEGQRLDVAALKKIHRHKTGALIRASVNMATLASGALSPAQAEALDRYAQSIGLAFQIQDDLLDVEGDTAVIGKTSGADEAHHKATYPSLLGLDEAHAQAREQIDSALAALAGFDAGADPLRWIARYIIDRDR